MCGPTGSSFNTLQKSMAACGGETECSERDASGTPDSLTNRPGSWQALAMSPSSEAMRSQVVSRVCRVGDEASFGDTSSPGRFSGVAHSYSMLSISMCCDAGRSGCSSSIPGFVEQSSFWVDLHGFVVVVILVHLCCQLDSMADRPRFSLGDYSKHRAMRNSS